jgi:hypothetical protein
MNKPLILLCSIFISQSVFGWGQVGHRVTGEIAEQYLSIKAKQQIRSLYPNESLAEISTYADEERSNPDEFWKKTAGPWHYVTIPKGKTYKEVGAPEEGDAYSALQQFSKTLKNPQASNEEKRLALHFIVHIVGDLHQPLHAGNGTDKGGNDFKLEYFWEASNLHRVWDSGIIEGQELSYTEWTKWLSRKISPQMAAQWNQPDPNVWIAESIAIRDNIYPEENKISYDYKYQNLPVVKQRLQQAGVRIAAYLNRVYE